MLVAYELGKTVGEIKALSMEELTDWVAFLNLRRKAQDKAYNRRQRV